MSPPTSAAVPITSAIADASPAPVPATPSTTTGRYGRLIWLARNETPIDQEDAADGRVGQDGPHRAEGEGQDPPLRDRPTGGPRASRT